MQQITERDNRRIRNVGTLGSLGKEMEDRGRTIAATDASQVGYASILTIDPQAPEQKLRHC